MKKINKPFIFLIAVTILVFSVSSCAKSKVEKNFEGLWNIQEIANDGTTFFIDGANTKMTWAFDKITQMMTSELITTDSSGTTTEIESSAYEVQDRESILLDNEWFSINLLTSSQLVLSNGYITVTGSK